MLRVVACLALALSLVGCYAGGAGASPGESLDGSAAPSASPSGPVPLLTVETQTRFGFCVLDAFYVSDVIADPTSGAPSDAATGESFAWPKGFTARRAGSEVEVFDAAGNVVLMTGQRYRVCPSVDDTNLGSGAFARSSGGAWVIGRVEECMGCELEGYGWPFDFVNCTANPTHWTCPRPGGPSPTPPQPPR
jgi:hypothetical protein